ncbi:glutathione-dependent formaldehyde-activating [Arthroderma uncinatum]|uniref:glutathione-dependent formaldehyde-activating n=1 Tax=Arthroderma uncinatum TaxID=74035 RepID=UPI00144AA1AA|nr:glutathione-dependent formaldehyde-activating [Arthroderma uncinatum]KAF3483298.1 glutathione-dependent formaldehyde-activating [Arthroderma uncinatum]
MSTEVKFPVEGGCDCKEAVLTIPSLINAGCQRETGSAFAINAVIESDRFELSKGKTETIHTPSESGIGQDIVRCSSCRVALWSHYPNTGKLTSFVRVGTLDDPNNLPPDVHIFTSTKQKWVVIPPGVPAAEIFYELDKTWSKESLERMEVLKPAIEKHKEDLAKRGLKTW